MKFGRRMYPDNRTNPIEFQVKGQGHNFPQWTKVHQIVLSNVEKIVGDNAVFRLSIAWDIRDQSLQLSKI